ncbi:MAG: isocitrate lyase/phosphoenolpyruvate mutase family protein [Bdellovibrionota bacterium]
MAGNNSSLPPTAALRKRLSQPGPVLIAGAHSALSAKLVEEAGFDGIWASGFEISASRAVPDANILTMAESLEAARQMAEAVRIPVIADCDNGFGNAINVIRTVQDYERAGIAGICIEDNIFPKRCSFYAGVKRELATVEEHAGKIRAAVDARRNPDFVVIARTEALIAGWGLEEALRRARAYADAGADLCLIHSKSKDFGELKAFTERWDRKVPLVSVPTIYKDTTASELERHGFKVVIFANHALRSSVKAMQETLAELKREQKPGAVDKRIVPLEEIYRLVGVPDLNANEKTYLPAGTQDVRAIILAAGADKDLLPLTQDRPKCMLDVKGRTILDRQVELLNSFGIKDICVVRGYRKDAIDLPNLQYVDNNDYETTGEVASLFAASDHLKGRVLVLYGDILFERSVLEKLFQSEAEVSLVVDRSWCEHRGNGAGAGKPDLVCLSNPSTAGARQINLDGPTAVKSIGRKLDPQQADAEFIGLAMFSPEGTEKLLSVRNILAEHPNGKPFGEAPEAKRAGMTDVVSHLLAKGGRVAGVEIYKGWMEVDSFEDYRRMWADTAK